MTYTSLKKLYPGLQQFFTTMFEDNTNKIENLLKQI